MVLAHNIEDGERTQDVRISQNVTFDSMLLASDTLQGLKKSGFYKPSPIQLHGIPLGKCGFDLLLEAKSGTGKTAVFSVISLEQLNLSKGLQTIILAPTREIAAQISDVLKQIGSNYEGLRVEVVMGGLPVKDDILKFKGNKVHIVVGSPGRLRHLIQDKHINISAVRLLVLDEADKLLDKSFLADINFIFSILPKQKQVIMSSATYPEEIKTFIKQYVQNAHLVCPDTNSILLGIKQKVTVVKHHTNIVKQTKYRFDELLKILSRHSFKQCLIFCNYQARVGELHKMLTRLKWPAEQLYGQQEQLDRLDALKSLQEYKCRILISTDLAARGIDASNVDMVINFEPPFEWQTYLHRIGRAGRFGSYGIAITILSEGKEQNKFNSTLSTIKAPINLSNLWEDEEPTKEITDETSSNLQLSVPSNSESNPVDVKITVNYEKLWKVLTNNLEKCTGMNVEVSESFENLCSSFNTLEENKTDTAVQAETNGSEKPCTMLDQQYLKDKELNEKFEILCDSFKTFEENNQVAVADESNSYQHLRIKPIVFAEYFQYIKPVTDTLQGKDEKLKVQKKEKCSGNKLAINNNNYEGTSDVSGNSTKQEAKTSKHKRSNSRRKFHNTKQPSHMSHSTNENIVSSDVQALINAGLPTAFGSAKKTYNHSKFESNFPYRNGYQIDYKEAKVSRNKGLSYNDTECSDTSEGFYNKRSENTQVHDEEFSDFLERLKKSANAPIIKINESGYDVDDETYDYDYNTTRRQHTKPYDIGTKNKYKGSSKVNSNSSLEISTSDDDGSATAASLDYVNWYNKLKFQVKQVELAIYVEEMSK